MTPSGSHGRAACLIEGAHARQRCPSPYQERKGMSARMGRAEGQSGHRAGFIGAAPARRQAAHLPARSRLVEAFVEPSCRGEPARSSSASTRCDGACIPAGGSRPGRGAPPSSSALISVGGMPACIRYRTDSVREPGSGLASTAHATMPSRQGRAGEPCDIGVRTNQPGRP